MVCMEFAGGKQHLCLMDVHCCSAVGHFVTFRPTEEAIGTLLRLFLTSDIKEEEEEVEDGGLGRR